MHQEGVTDRVAMDDESEHLQTIHRGRTEADAEFFWLGHDVCRERDFQASEDKAADRYMHKMDVFKQLANDLDEDPNNMKKWIGLSVRVRQFKSCAQVGIGNSTVPPQLLKAMTSGDNQLEEGLLASKDALQKMMEGSGGFPEFDDLPGCRFAVKDLDVQLLKQSTTPEESIRQQVFGQDCDEAASKDYTSRLDGSSKRVAMVIMGPMMQLVAARKKGESQESPEAKKAVIAEEVQKLAAELSNNLDDAAKALDDASDDVLDAEYEDVPDELAEKIEKSIEDDELVAKTEDEEIFEKIENDELAENIQDVAVAEETEDESSLIQHERKEDATASQDERSGSRAVYEKKMSGQVSRGGSRGSRGDAERSRSKMKSSGGGGLPLVVKMLLVIAIIIVVLWVLAIVVLHLYVALALPAGASSSFSLSGTMFWSTAWR